MQWVFVMLCNKISQLLKRSNENQHLLKSMRCLKGSQRMRLTNRIAGIALIPEYIGDYCCCFDMQKAFLSPNYISHVAMVISNWIDRFLASIDDIIRMRIQMFLFLRKIIKRRICLLNETKFAFIVQ